MSISLQKGQKISLTKDNSSLDKIILGLGWDQVSKSGGVFFSVFTEKVNIDCDATVMLLQNGKMVDKKDLVYFGNLKHYTSSVIHTGDNLTGKGEGDDEQIVVELKKIPEKYDSIVIVVNIFRAKERKQHFGMIKNAFIRLVDTKTNEEICRYNLTDDYSGSTALIFGEVYRHNGEWKFNPIGQGTIDDGMGELVARYK